MTTNQKLLLSVTLVGLWGLIIWKTELLSHLNLEIIKTHHSWLQQQLKTNYIQILCGSLLVYFLFVAMSLPGIFVLAISCGYLFGATLGTSILILVGSLAACVPCLASRFLLSEWVGQKFSKWVPAITNELERRPTIYMLAMRLNPAIPFMVQNTVPGLLKIPMKIYVPTTLIGLTPPSIAYAVFGDGLHEIFLKGGEVTLKTILSPQILASVSLVSFLVFIPLVVRVIKSRANTNK